MKRYNCFVIGGVDAVGMSVTEVDFAESPEGEWVRFEDIKVQAHIWEETRRWNKDLSLEVLELRRQVKTSTPPEVINESSDNSLNSVTEAVVFDEDLVRDHFYRKHPKCMRNSSAVNHDVECARWMFDKLTGKAK